MHHDLEERSFLKGHILSVAKFVKNNNCFTAVFDVKDISHNSFVYCRHFDMIITTAKLITL